MRRALGCADSTPANGKKQLQIQTELSDKLGILECRLGRRVQVKFEVADILQGYGSAKPCNEELFDKEHHDTFFDNAQAIGSAGWEPGKITVKISSDGPGLEELKISLRQQLETIEYASMI